MTFPTYVFSYVKIICREKPSFAGGIDRNLAAM
jgi:hypothetical protein